MLSFSRPWRRLPRLAALLFLLCAALAAGPVLAQAAAPEPAPAAAGVPDGLSAGDLKDLAARLEDEAERRKLVETLRGLAAARGGADDGVRGGADGGAGAAPSDAEADPGSAIVDSVMAQMRRAGSALAAASALFSDLPALADWAQQQAADPRRRAIWADVLLKLGASIIAAFALQAVAFAALRRPMAALAGQPAQSVWVNLLLLVLRVIVALVPIAVFAGAAYGILGLLAPGPLTRDLARFLVQAFVAVRAVQIAGHILLAPDSASGQNAALRLLRVGDETAVYVSLWLGRLAVLGFFGHALVLIATRVRIPPEGVDAVAKLLAFAFAAMVAVLVLQNRSAVAAHLRGNGQPAGDEDAPRPQGNAMRLLRHRAADIWHVLALLYIGATYAIWAFEIDGGFRLILRGTLLTVAILVVTRLLLYAADRGIHRLFAISAETRLRFPGLEARANRYLPVLLGAVRVLLYVVAAFAVLQAWGLDTLGWLGSAAGRGAVARLTTIALVLLVTVALWEAIATGIEYYLTQPGPDGTPTPRSGRVRTLLPLLRRTVTVILGLIAGLIILSELGINIAPLLAGAGVIGLAVGFGAQTLVKDVITGAFILMEDTVSVGDVVDLGGNAGVVEDISIRTIRLRDLNGTVHVIPFSEVTRVQNMTRGFSYALIDAGVAYRENVDDVIAVLQELGEAMRQEPDWAARILEPLEVLGLDQLADSAVVIRVRFKTVAGGQWAVRREFQRRMKARFDELGIEIPFPHQTIYFGIDKQGKAPPVFVAQDGPAEKPAAAAAAPAPRKLPPSDVHDNDAPDDADGADASRG